MDIRRFFSVCLLLCLAFSAARSSAHLQWPGPSLHPYTERVVEHIPADCDPAQVIPMMLCPDAKYLPHAGVTLTSLLENANPDYAYDVYIVSDARLTDKQKKPWMELGEQYADSVSFNITLIDGSVLIDTSQLSGGVWGSTALYRLAAPEIDAFEKYDQMIYIDCDMIIYDIIPFWTQSLTLENGHEAWFAAVKDIMQTMEKVCPRAVEGLIKRMPQLAEEPRFVCEDYINSGLLLMNLKELRLNEFTASVLDFIQTKKPFWVDQDAINALAFHRLKRLEFKYAYPFKVSNSKPEGIYVLHYVDKPKPWNMRLPSDPDLISSLSDYHFYRQKSPWQWRPSQVEAEPSARRETRAAALKRRQQEALSTLYR